jgi:hypothetical protein
MATEESSERPLSQLARSVHLIYFHPNPYEYMIEYILGWRVIRKIFVYNLYLISRYHSQIRAIVKIGNSINSTIGRRLFISRIFNHKMVIIFRKCK